MWKWILLFLTIASVENAHADVLFLLEKGAIRKIHGTITQEVPGVSVSIRTHDGQDLVFQASDLVNIIRDAEDTSPMFQGQTTIQNRDHRSPGIALMFSLLIPGGGQFYNGETGKGVVGLVGGIGGVVLALATLPSVEFSNFETVEVGNPGLSTAGLSIAVVASVWSVIDAPLSSRRINRRLGLAKLDHGKSFGLAYRWSF